MGTAVPPVRYTGDPAEPVKYTGGPAELRAFPVATLMEQANAILEAIPLDHRAATVIAADGDGVSMFAAVRLKHGWTFQGKLAKPWHGKLEGQVQLVWSQ